MNNPTPKSLSQQLIITFVFSSGHRDYQIKYQMWWCGDLSIPKATKCQIYKQFMNEYKFSTIKNEYLLVRVTVWLTEKSLKSI